MRVGAPFRKLQTSGQLFTTEARRSRRRLCRKLRALCDSARHFVNSENLSPKSFCIRARLPAVPKSSPPPWALAPDAVYCAGAKALTSATPCSARLKSCPDTNLTREHLSDRPLLAPMCDYNHSPRRQ